MVWDLLRGPYKSPLFTDIVGQGYTQLFMCSDWHDPSHQLVAVYLPTFTIRKSWSLQFFSVNFGVFLVCLAWCFLLPPSHEKYMRSRHNVVDKMWDHETLIS